MSRCKIRISVHIRAVIITFCSVFLYVYPFLAETTQSANAEEKNDTAGLVKGKYKGYNIIMISINNVGVEHMSLYGYQRRTTPVLDGWSQGAFIFEDVFSPASWTLPAATSLFTSLQPYSHKIMDRSGKNLLDKSIQTLPEILRDNKYATAAFTGGLDYMKIFGHMRGFTDIDNNQPFTGFSVSLSQAKAWLSKNSDKKFFLVIQGYDAHPPFKPSQKFRGVFSNPKGKHITVDSNLCLRGYKNSNNEYVAAHYIKQDPLSLRKKNKPDKAVRQGEKSAEPKWEKEVILTKDDINYLRDLYDEEVLSVDSLIGNFLNSLNKELLNKTIIVVFSEHGEMFAKHGRFGRAGTIRGTLYNDVVHVPLIIKFPQVEGKRIKGLVQIIDIMPTLLDILDIPFSPQIQGKSLVPLINGFTPVNDYVYAGLQFNTQRPQPHPFFNFESINESIRNYKWKLIHEIIYPSGQKNVAQNHSEEKQEETFELYDLQNDQNELTNLVEKYPEVMNELKGKLGAWAKQSQEFVPVVPSTRDFPNDLLEEAKKKGYW